VLYYGGYIIIPEIEPNIFARRCSMKKEKWLLKEIDSWQQLELINEEPI